MIWALLLVQAAAVPVTDEVVVRAERLNRLRLSAQVDKAGRVRCRIKRSSGDPATDALGCAAVQDCASRPIGSAREAEACVTERIKARFGGLLAPAPSGGGSDRM